MQKRPVVVALVLAGVIAGTTAGIAAINSEATPLAEPVAAQPAAEVQAPAEAQAAVETQEATPAQEQTVTAVAQPAHTTAAPPPPAASNKDDVKMVRIPFTNYYVTVTNPTFPSSFPETPDPLPSTIAYFDQLEATRLAAAQQAASTPVATLEALPAVPAPAQATPQPVQPAVQAALTGR